MARNVVAIVGSPNVGKSTIFNRMIGERHAIVDDEEPWNNMPAYDTKQTRFCIVSTETGEILDDAQGWGYKTAQKAYAAFAYKNRDKSKDAEKRAKKKRIQKWMKEHKSFVDAMDTFAFEIAKGSWGPDDKFDAKFVKKMLADNDLAPDFTARDLLNVWRNQ